MPAFFLAGVSEAPQELTEGFLKLAKLKGIEIQNIDIGG